MVIKYKGYKVRELRSDNDVVQVKGHQIRWNKKFQRYTIRDVKNQIQIYDTEYYDDAVTWVIDNVR